MYRDFKTGRVSVVRTWWNWFMVYRCEGFSFSQSLKNAAKILHILNNVPDTSTNHPVLATPDVQPRDTGGRSEIPPRHSYVMTKERTLLALRLYDERFSVSEISFLMNAPRTKIDYVMKRDRPPILELLEKKQ